MHDPGGPSVAAVHRQGAQVKARTTYGVTVLLVALLCIIRILSTVHPNDIQPLCVNRECNLILYLWSTNDISSPFYWQDIYYLS